MDYGFAFRIGIIHKSQTPYDGRLRMYFSEDNLYGFIVTYALNVCATIVIMTSSPYLVIILVQSLSADINCCTLLRDQHASCYIDSLSVFRCPFLDNMKNEIALYFKSSTCRSYALPNRTELVLLE